MKKENFKSNHSFLIELLIGFIIAIIAYSITIILSPNQNKKQEYNEIIKINDSTYHINYNDGISCARVELHNDTLSVNAINTISVNIVDDTVILSGARNSHRTYYAVAYNNLFKDNIPCKENIIINLN